MGKKVLIVDDENAAATAMAELCRAIGVDAVAVTKVPDVLPAVSRERPDLVVLDLFLPGTTGLALAEQIRGLPHGASVPLLAVSGVLKKQNVARELGRLRAEFLSKPFDAGTFQQAVASKLGLSVPGVERAPSRPKVRRQTLPQVEDFEADLGQTPPFQLFKKLLDARASGHLDLVHGKVRRRLTFQSGTIRYATSNVAKEMVGGMQVARGTLDRASFDRAVARARETKRPLGETLMALGIFDRGMLDRATKEQTREVAVQCLALRSGQAKFTVDPAGASRVPDARVHPMWVVVEGIRRFYTAATLENYLKARSHLYVHRTEALQRDEYVLRQSTPGVAVLPAIDGSRRMGELLERARAEDLPLLFALVCTGTVKLEATPQAKEATETASAEASGVQAGTPPAVAAPALTQAQADAALDAGRSFSPEEQKARRLIEETYARFENATHYEVLGVEPSADAAAVQQAYLQAAKSWHSDRFSGLELGSAQRKLEAIFARIGEAREVLSDPEKKAEYDIYLDRKAKGLPTDVAAILKAEELFQKAEKLLEAGKATQALEHLEEAIRLNHAEPEFYAYRAYARYLVQGAEAKALVEADFAKAREGSADMPSLPYLQGLIAAREGDLEEARRLFRRTLLLDPDHAKAQLQVRILDQKAKRQKKGLLGKLLK